MQATTATTFSNWSSLVGFGIIPADTEREKGRGREKGGKSHDRTPVPMRQLEMMMSQRLAAEKGMDLLLGLFF